MQRRESPLARDRSRCRAVLQGWRSVAIAAVVGAIGLVAWASDAVAEAGWTDYAVVT
jgi:hypothetical protein